MVAVITQAMPRLPRGDVVEGMGLAEGRVRVAFIGCGGNARGHVQSVLQVPEADVVALCDVRPESIEQVAQRVPQIGGLPRFTDYRAMIDEVHPDAVIISIPHTLHYEAAAYAIEHGAHVQVEKPMACSSDEARRLLAARDRHGKVLLVGYQRHYQAGYRWVRDAVTSGRYGPVHFVEAWQAQDWKGAGWRGVPSLSGGGQLNDSGSHLVDIVLWTSGLQPREVFAFADNRGRQVDVLSAISFRCEGGAIGCLSIVGEHPRGLAEGLQIWCRDARIFVDTGVHLQTKGGPPAAVPEDEMSAFPGNKDANFVRAILGQEAVQVPGECGLAVAAFTEAVYASVASGQPASVAG